MPHPLWERFSDRSSPPVNRRQLRTIALAGGIGVAVLAGVALRDDEPQAVAAGVLPLTAAVSTLHPAAPAAPVARVAALEISDPAQAGLDPSRLQQAVGAVRSEVRRGAFPGAVIGVGRGPSLVLLEGMGRTAWNDQAVDAAKTVYDLASLTKVVATTTAVMLLVEDGKLELDAPVQRYLPEFSGDAKVLITVRHLLSHTSGLPAGVGVHGLSSEAAMRKLLHTPLKFQPGTKAEYSDVGFVVLYAAAERAAGEPIPQLLERRVFAPLGMHSTGYQPGEGCAQCAPTLVEGGRIFQGVVHDPTVRQLGGVGGSAGLFGTATDLARFAAMMANGGELDGVRILKEETVRNFTARQNGAGTRALGWDTPERDGTGAAGVRISPRAFGHTGYTGTSLWVDPDRRTWTILLTNRTYEPRAPNRIQAVRRAVNDGVAMAAIADSSERARGE
jgi:CubicO group peptidase (beta-lactamase class C family)